MGFDVVFLGKACDEAVKVDAVSAFDAVVANDQGKKHGVSVMHEHAWLGLVVSVLEEEGSDVLTCMQACLAKTRHGLIYAGVEKIFACFIFLHVRSYVQINEELV
jgi:hypothetical protein